MDERIEIGIESSPGSKVTIHLPPPMPGEPNILVSNLGAGEVTVTWDGTGFHHTFSIVPTPVLCRDVLRGIGIPGPTYLCELPMGHDGSHRSGPTMWAPLDIDVDYEAGVPSTNELPIVPPYAGA